MLFGGLCNQIYSHIGMLALTVELGAEAVRFAGRSLVPAVVPTPAHSTRAAVPVSLTAVPGTAALDAPPVVLCLRATLVRCFVQVLPDAVHRGGRGFQDNWRGGEIQPLRRPMNTLFDVDHLVAWARQRQTVLHKVL